MSTAALPELEISFLPAGLLTTEPEIRFAAADGVTAKPEPKKKTRFVLFSEHWINLQVYIQRALALPVSGKDFEDRYGSFTSSYKAVIDGVVAAMQNVQAATKEFGSPKAIRDALAENPDALSGGKSTELYARIVVLATVIESQAKSFSYTIDSLMQMIGPAAGTPAQRKAILKDILTGEGGLVSQAEDVLKIVTPLVQDLMTFDKKMSAANKTLLAYTTPGTMDGKSLVAEVDRLIEDDAKTVDNVLRPAAAQAYRIWVGLATGASTASVLITVLTGGFLLPVAAVAGGTMGGVSEIYHREYNDYLKQIAQKDEDKRKKNELKGALVAFNTEIPHVAESLAAFAAALSQIETVWINTKLKFERMAEVDALDRVIKMPAVNMVMHCNDATLMWKEIAEATEDFTANSLIQFHLLPFGTEVK